MKLTHTRLLELLSYDAESGAFSWNVDRGKQRSKGLVAGGVNVHGYVQIGIDGDTYLGHRLAWFYMTGEWPPEVDHRNTIRSDNSWRNLRLTTRSLNNGNSRRRSNNTSGSKGVTWDRSRGQWMAQIAYKGKRTFLGRYDGIEDAKAAYRRAAARTFGEFARP